MKIFEDLLFLLLDKQLCIYGHMYFWKGDIKYFKKIFQEKTRMTSAKSHVQCFRG